MPRFILFVLSVAVFTCGLIALRAIQPVEFHLSLTINVIIVLGASAVVTLIFGGRGASPEAPLTSEEQAAMNALKTNQYNWMSRADVHKHSTATVEQTNVGLAQLVSRGKLRHEDLGDKFILK